MLRWAGFILFFAGCCLSSDGRAASRMQYYAPAGRTRIVVWDKQSREPLVGATVAIACGADTLRGTTVKRSDGYGLSAQYACDRIFRDSVSLEVEYLGYAPFRKRYAAAEFGGYIGVRLESDSLSIAQVTIVGERVAMVFRGDTTVYDAAAFRTMADDRLAELLRQLPGVEIRDDRIYADGEQVRRVYVDGRNLFGRRPEASLTDLDASDVRSVRIYDEPSPEAGRTGDASARKEKVMDVRTASRRSILRGGEAALTAGASIEKEYTGEREIRRAERLRLYRHSERGSIGLEGSDAKDENGLDDPSVGSRTSPAKYTRARLSHEYRRGDSTSVWTMLHIDRDRTTTQELSDAEYLPTQAYARRYDENSSRSLAKSFSADMNNLTSIQRGQHLFAASLSANYRRGTSRGTTRTLQRIDDLETRTSMRSEATDRNFGFDLDASYSMRLSERSRLSFQAGGHYSSSDSEGWQVDTVASTPGLRMQLLSDGIGKRYSASAGVAYHYKFGRRSSLAASYRFSADDNRSRRTAIDYLHDPCGRLDTVNSHDYTVDRRTHELALRWNRSAEHLHCDVNLRSQLYELLRHERFPETERAPRRFFALAPDLNLSYGTPRRKWSFYASASPLVPSAEALRSSLDATDPLLLRTGNSDLKLPVILAASLRLQLNDPSKARVYSFGVRGGYDANFIASRTTLFLQPTYLAQWDYTAQQGAQLVSETNVGGKYALGADASWTQRVAALRSTLRVATAYGFDRTPYFLGERLFDSRQHTLQLSLGFDSGFSDKIRISLDTHTDLSSYTTQRQTRRSLQQHANLRAELHLGNYFGNANTAYEFYRNSASKALTRHRTILNIAAGRKFGRESRFSLSVGAVDLLDGPDYVSTHFATDHILTSTNSYLGRYLYLRAAHTF